MDLMDVDEVIDSETIQNIPDPSDPVTFDQTFTNEVYSANAKSQM